MIIVLEPTLRGSGHSALNAGVLSILLRAFPTTSLVFLGEAGHIQQVQALLAESDRTRVAFKALGCPLPMLGSLRSRAAQRLLVAHLAPLLQGVAAAYLLTLSIHRNMVEVVSAAARRLSPLCPLQTHFVLHGTNRGNFLTRSRNPLVRWRDLPASIARYTPELVRYLVLDEATVPGWVELCPHLSERIGVLEIALDESEARAPQVRHQLGTPVRFGLLGQATAAKGFFEFRQLATRFAEARPLAPEFHLVGRLGSALATESCDHLILHSPNIQVPGQPPAQLPRSDYISSVAALDYACLLYAGDYYDSAASGVFFDAVNLTRPIIARPTAFVERAFSEFGDIGFLCRTHEEVIKTVAGIIAGEYSARYSAQVNALAMARLYWLPGAIAVRFRDWLSRVNPRLVEMLDGSSVVGRGA